MSKLKQIPVWRRAVGGGVVFLVVFWIAIEVLVRAQSPAMPEQWRMVQGGMTSEDLVQALSGFVYTDMRELKGYDLIRSAGKREDGEAIWHLLVYYDERGGANRADAKMYHPLSTHFDRIVVLIGE